MGMWRKLGNAWGELTVVGSYGRSGFRRRAKDFDPEALVVDLTGERHVVTGATSGIGLAAARALAARGASVVLVGRDAARLEAASAEVPGSSVCRCDLSDLAAVGGLCDELLALGRVTSIVHNAGFIVAERRLTPQGHESAFATHVLAPYLMTKRLSARLAEDPAGGRVIWVSSGGMYTQRLDLGRAQALTGAYDGVKAYAQHKRAQVLLNEVFDRRFTEAGLAVTSNAMHPGWVDTPGVERGLPGFHRRMRKVLRSADEGADTIVWLAAAKPVPPSGRFYLDRVARRTEVLPWTRHGDDDRRALEALCEELTGA